MTVHACGCPNSLSSLEIYPKNTQLYVKINPKCLTNSTKQVINKIVLFSFCFEYLLFADIQECPMYNIDYDESLNYNLLKKSSSNIY